jgi:hypothetical protein
MNINLFFVKKRAKNAKQNNIMVNGFLTKKNKKKETRF